MKLASSFYHTLRFWVLITILSIVLGTLSVIVGVFDRSGNTSHKIAALWSKLICRWNGIRVEISGMENLLQNRAQIFIANHQGYYDIFALSGYLPVQLRWVSKASLFRVPFMGWAMSAARYIPVERGDRKKSYQAFLTTIESVKAGNSVVIFPEGTRSEDGTIGPFKKGSQLLAQRADVPMVPVTITGTRNIIRKGSMMIHPGLVRITISPCISLEGGDKKKGDESLEAIRDTICKNFEKNVQSD
ncbi:MAG TPA: lysophospholipid acyltransferase family protein [Nitrospinaceae bacterium]|nr:lysophospholipid acyltransferase family protein [Nitrospinaceae bacterium]HJO00635.1 lysophospholipid acyltransferase family protein [Nitrospinaceae bacterium]